MTDADTLEAERNGRSTGDVQLWRGSADHLTPIDSDSVSLTICSPPFVDLIDYSTEDRKHANNDLRVTALRKVRADREARVARGASMRSYEAFLDFMERCFQEVWSVTKPGGFLALQVASMKSQGIARAFHIDLAARLMKNGTWLYHDHIIWHKARQTTARGGHLIRYKRPGYFFTGLWFEHVIVLRKAGAPIHAGRSESEKHRSSIPITGAIQRDVVTGVWHIPPAYAHNIGHPTPFAEQLVKRLVLLYSYSGDLVLDPFMGCGEVPRVAHQLGRKGAGCDIEERFVRLAQSRMSIPLNPDPTVLVPRYERVYGDAFARYGATDWIQKHSTHLNAPATGEHRPKGRARGERPAKHFRRASKKRTASAPRKV